jgi:hydroxyacylglutathione hydrolase
MLQIAPGVWLLRGLPFYAINVYLVQDVLIDGGIRWQSRRVRAQLHGRRVTKMALTHCHPDHQGVAHYLCRTLGLELACHELDVPAMEGTGPMLPNTFIVNVLGRVIAGAPHKVHRVLREGDEIAGFRVVHAPGHTPGHVIYFRESDRVAIAGDVLANLNFLTFAPALRLPPAMFCVDPQQNFRSVEILANLRPSLVAFGHGPPLHRTEQLQWFVERVKRRMEKK